VKPIAGPDAAALQAVARATTFAGAVSAVATLKVMRLATILILAGWNCFDLLDLEPIVSRARAVSLSGAPFTRSNVTPPTRGP